METYSRVLGAFLGAALGDAMGANTESKTPAMILARYGRYLDDLLPGGDDTFVRGRPAGFVTDDFSLAWFTAQVLLEHRGQVTQETAEAALLRWAEHPEYFALAGPTTRAAVAALRGAPAPAGELDFLACDNAKATNGSAMKIFPAGLLHPGDPDGAIRDAVTLCLPTHNNAASLSGACAVAAAVAAAAGGGTPDDALDAGFYGARRGAEHGRPVSVASVEKRMELAVAIARRGRDWEQTMLELGSVVGAGIAVNEAVPCAFGILAATKGRVLPAVRMGVNVGNDTDTVATMAGAVAGALSGAEAVPARFLETICAANAMDLPAMARAYEEAFYR